MIKESRISTTPASLKRSLYQFSFLEPLILLLPAHRKGLDLRRPRGASIFNGLVYICQCWCPHIHVTGVPEGLAQAFKTFGDSRVAATIPAPGL